MLTVEQLKLAKSKKVWLIDCDGTLADTMPAHNKAYELAFALNGVPFDIEEHNYWAPLGGKELMKHTVIEKGHASKVQDIVRDKQRLLDICLEKFMKPNKALISWIRDTAHYLDDRPRIYIVSNGRKASIQKVLNALGIAYHVDGLITPEILGTVKPSPEPYNYAMILASIELGRKISPSDVIVFEDNDIGETSALNAGIKDIVMVNTNEF